MKVKFLLTALFVMGLISISDAQILNDSTKVLYGTNSIRYQTLDQFKEGNTEYHKIDSVLVGLTKFYPVEREGYQYQDLGNPGSAMFSIFPKLPETSGVRTGMGAYDYYYKRPKETPLFQTLSPYSSITAIFGGGGRGVVDFTFTRNIKPNWNIGFEYNRLVVERAFNRVGRGDNGQDINDVRLWTNYISDNGKFKNATQFVFFNAKGAESGGVVVDLNNPNYFEYELSSVLSKKAVSKDGRMNFHTFNNYQLDEKFQLFQELDILAQNNRFEHAEAGQEPAYAESILIDPDATADHSKFNFVTNTLGIKGTYRGFFYSAYLKNRYSNYSSRYLGPVASNFENFVGGTIKMKFDSLHYINIAGEVNEEFNHKLVGDYTNKYFNVKYTRMQFAPGYTEQRYLSNHADWTNDFKSTQVDQIEAKITLNLFRNRLYLAPKVNVTNYVNKIYYDYADRGNELPINETNPWVGVASPKQSGDAVQVASAGWDMKINFWKNFYFENSVLASAVNGGGEDIIRIPALWTNSSLYFNKVFPNRLEVLLGVDLNYTTAYKGMMYDPTIQQFYLQDGYETFGQPIVDLNVEMKITRFRLFVKLRNIAAQDGDGYFMTPFYPGYKNTFDLGIVWQFFDNK
ncbi:hypothetical protein PEPS_17620 [Persicobacter psychrovividus]|uniref:Porin n=2 Tax=Persicobacter psychrovividus TaxID=387638 RepID=A0ABN6L8E5_9BACT|nr:hypothetical protein PEPS_17620 [Persicobacter psychrovividus]